MIEDIDQLKKARRKVKVVTFPNSKDQIEICGLSAAGWSALMRCRDEKPEDSTAHAGIVCLHGAPIFAGKSLEDVLEAIELPDVIWLATEIQGLTAVEEDPAGN